MDSVETNTDFAKSLDLDYPILSDPDKTFSTALGCLNARGLINRWTYYVGEDGKILYVDKSVKAADHGSAIAEKLGELGIKKKSAD